MNPEFLVITSIPPHLGRRQRGKDVGADYQRACVDSWIDAGFSVVSVNEDDEADLLRQWGLPVEIETIGSRARPRIRDMLKVASASGAQMCGIVNADCMFVRLPRLASNLAEHVDNSLLFSERIDINPETDYPIPGHCGGFDAFFFKPASVVGVTDEFYHIGDPWWDYWFPCELAASGIALRRLSTPFVLHLGHERGWSPELHLRNGAYFRAFASRLEAEGRAPRGLSELLAESDRVPVLARLTYAWLRQHSTSIGLLSPQDAPMEDLLRKLRESHLADGASQTQQIKRLTNQRRVAQHSLEALRAERKELKTSLSQLSDLIEGMVDATKLQVCELHRDTRTPLHALIQRAGDRGLGTNRMEWLAAGLVSVLVVLSLLLLPSLWSAVMLSALVGAFFALTVIFLRGLHAAQSRFRQARSAYGQLADQLGRLRHEVNTAHHV